MMADLIRYDLLVQDALRGVVRQVLTDVARNGLQGEHHFFVTFKTATPGLRLSNRMRERYPDEMTVILQHQFWGLTVTETGFEVGLSFNNAPERLYVPFAAIVMFQDPSVTFGLKFDVKEGAGDGSARPVLAEATKSPLGKRALATVETNLPARIGDTLSQQDDKPRDERDRGDKAKGERSADPPPKSRPVLAKVADTSSDETDKSPPGGTKVVSIDAFRKKP